LDIKNAHRSSRPVGVFVDFSVDFFLTFIQLNSKIVEILNLQPKGAKAKPYQVKQVRNVIIKYKLGGEQID